MHAGEWFRLLLIGCLLGGYLCGPAGAVILGTDWKERAPEEGPYSGVMIVPDASLVYAGGSVIYVRSWDGSIRWANRPARVAAISSDGERVVLGVGEKLAVLDRKGIENWSRNMDGYVKAVAMSSNGSFIISADDRGNYVSWKKDGEFVARITNDSARAMAYSPAGDLVVVSTDKGLRFYNRKLELEWYDNRTQGWDEFIAISGDGSAIITAGNTQVASYDSDGTLNWRYAITKEPIIDMDCSEDCSVIVVAGQDREVIALDRNGMVSWRYKVGQWVNAVGVSGDASVIAAGGIDRTLYVFDRDGTIITTKKTDAIIQPRSIAVSSNGKRIVAADQMNLYGYSLIGDTGTPSVTALSTQEYRTTVPTACPATEQPTATATRDSTTAVPVATASTVPAKPTTYAPTSPLLLVPGTGAALLLFRSRR